MIDIKSKSGITIIILILTIVIILILTGTIIYTVNSSSNIDELNNMYADIELLEEKILVYYNKYGDIPKKSTNLNEYNIEDVLGQEKNINDNNVYYEIDASKLENITLKYGEGTGYDKYIINEKTLTIYYLAGIENEGTTYHRYPYEYSEITNN